MSGEMQIAQTIANSSGGVWAGLIFLVLVLVPLTIKIISWSKEVSASGDLYKNLSEQVSEYRKELDTANRERNELFAELVKLRAQVHGLEDTKRIFDVLKGRLEEKDKIIVERDARIASLTQEVFKMKDRIHSLELRLAADEKEFCRQCLHPNPRPLVTV